MARVLGMAKGKSFKGGKLKNLAPELFQLADTLLIKEAQANIKDFGQYKTLNPRHNQEGIIVVGTRLSKFNPMALD